MILITGANGQLGTDFQKILNREKVDYIATDVDELDITNKNEIENFFKGKNIKIIINCAAYNNVDKAEKDSEICYKLNRDAPLYLAEAAQKTGAVFVTYSTDFVFDGTKSAPYKETDKPNPLSIYGRSKLEGEQAVLKIYNRSFVIRTSWVFGIANKNFNTQVIEWSKKNEELKIVDDQVSSPTYSYDLAVFSWMLINMGTFGLYHMSNGSEASKYDQAKYILEKIGWNGKLGRAKSSDFNLPAERPKYSKLDSEKLEKTVGKQIPDWKNAVDRYVEELNI
ncbi:dTDP-4-dehydrorhamnose reductase [Flexistipes sinusarabici DSM 4947]|uniref:dTDP-4-dehydrorhamnose reductase n=2 Tax=Flexistipes sinusarabici TaxID=2352 RepID=F8E4I9_FLESM|nr:dTDP-4-dehydrorhamnose reductase [Flexistipes sinusarabici]AEI14475.1 dTDP-4-dehydrorhamnose reductase [Flexistipes sinusarabici DSM 4947]HCW92196.1 dTDP-4-dehydrorhamnose reductase [Flexistipes sinusarabici]